MARGRRLNGCAVAAALVAAYVAGFLATPACWASEACGEGRGETGLDVTVRGGALTVADVAPGSAAARAGFRADDVMVQVNDVLPRTCAQWARVVSDARDGGKALLVLVRRGEAEMPLALGAAAWGGLAALPETRAPGADTAPPGTPPAGRPAGEAPAPSAATPGQAPAQRPPTMPARAPAPPPPPPLPPETAVSVEGVQRDLAALAPLDDPPTNLPAYRDAVLQVRRQVETLASRGSAPDDVVGELRGVARYYEGAVIAWEAIEGDRADERRSRRLPVADNMAVPYFGESPVASLLDEFDFLDATIARPPRGGGLAEASGLWRPVWARLLLWERGARALEELRARPLS